MAYNICWADPDVTECWSFRGRLYMSLKKAEQERTRLLDEYRDKYPSWAYYVAPPIYKINWVWEEVDA